MSSSAPSGATEDQITKQPNNVAPQEANEDSNKRSLTRIVLIMASLCIAIFLAALDSVIVATALPAISSSLHSSDSGYAWIASAYLLSTAASMPVWGRLSDIFGRKPATIGAAAVYFVASIVSALAVSLRMLTVGRAIQGIL